MLIKKLAVPLINEKILMQAERCYIATSAIAEEGFDLVVGRLSVKCKMELMTGLDGVTSPHALWRIWKHFTDRIALKIHTKQFFNANLYIFDLPFRKSVAFVGSGSFTSGGLKDNEEIFIKVTDPKEIENLKSWFIGFYEYAEPINESIIHEYGLIYPSLRQREIVSRQEKQTAMDLTTRGFNWDQIKFKNQYFKKEDYLVLGNGFASDGSPNVQAERERVKEKLVQLHELLKRDVSLLKLHESNHHDELVSSVLIDDHTDKKLKSIWLSYGRREADLKHIGPETRLHDVMSLQVVLRQKEIGVWLVPGRAGVGEVDREYFKERMIEPEYRIGFQKLLTGLGAGFFIEVAGETKPVESFTTDELLWVFIKSDDWKYFNFVIGKNYNPGDPAIANDQIVTTIAKDFGKLVTLYKHLEKPA